MITYYHEKEGHLHPLTIAIEDTVRIFTDMGFELSNGPEIEEEKNNFDDLNVPAHHPSRDLQDTFWLKDEPHHLLRTQTSAHQVPYMKEHGMPVHMFSCGKVFRNERTDATHEVQFYQVEGLMVDKKGAVTFGHLKGVLQHYIETFFGRDLEFRYRANYFPFVEPGIEMDIRSEDGTWIEVLGAGMVHPHVLENAGYDPGEYAGFAFGAGLDRFVMLRHGLTDVRMLYQGDLRFIHQF